MNENILIGTAEKKEKITHTNKYIFLQTNIITTIYISREPSCNTFVCVFFYVYNFPKKLYNFSFKLCHRRVPFRRPEPEAAESKRPPSPPSAHAPVPRLADYVWGARLPLPYAIPWLKPTLWSPGSSINAHFLT